MTGWCSRVLPANPTGAGTTDTCRDPSSSRPSTRADTPGCDALADLAGLVRAVGFRDPAKHLTMVTSIASDAWDRLFSGPRPAELHPFPELQGPRHHAPATPGDLLFHLRAESLDFCFELATQVLSALDGAVTVVDEVHGFRFFDNRDLLGFVDGTGRRMEHRRRTPRDRRRGIPTSPAAATCTFRSTCITCRRGTPCRFLNRSG